MTPLKAIRLKCLDCCCGIIKEVRLCSAEKCPLFPYRFGHKPKEGNFIGEDSLSKNTSVFQGVLTKDDGFK